MAVTVEDGRLVLSPVRPSARPRYSMAELMEGMTPGGTRPSLVLSPEAFNAFGKALAWPMTRRGAFARARAGLDGAGG